MARKARPSGDEGGVPEIPCRKGEHFGSEKWSQRYSEGAGSVHFIKIASNSVFLGPAVPCYYCLYHGLVHITS